MCVCVCVFVSLFFSHGLHLVFQDQLYDDFLKNGKFNGEGKVIPRRLNDLLMWSFWAVLTCVPLFYYITMLFLSGTLQQQLIFLGCVAICECVVWFKACYARVSTKVRGACFLSVSATVRNSPLQKYPKWFQILSFHLPPLFTLPYPLLIPSLCVYQEYHIKTI